MTILDAIIEMRGGLPEKCDFCGEPYNEHRHPTPDEGGEWACTECWARWDKEAAIRARGNVATNDTSQERVDKTSENVHKEKNT